MTTGESKANKKYIELLEKKIEKLQEQLKYYHTAIDCPISPYYQYNMSISNFINDEKEKEQLLDNAKNEITYRILKEIESKIIFKTEEKGFNTEVVGTIFIEKEREI